MSKLLSLASKFQLNFSVISGVEQNQRIRFAESTNLFDWKILPDVVFRVDTRWYSSVWGSGSTEGRWDTIATTPRPGGGYYGYWTARPKDKTYSLGFGETTDGIHWQARKPPKVDWESYTGYEPDYCEVGGVEVVDGKYHAMINFSRDGSRMLALVADRPEGPFALAKKKVHPRFPGKTHQRRVSPKSVV